MIHIHHRVNLGKQLNSGFHLMQQGHRIELSTTMAEVEESMSTNNLGSVIDEYRRTQISV